MKQLYFENYSQQPHGGTLIDRMVSSDMYDQEMERARNFPSIMVDMEGIITLEMIATGVLSPNEGFMNKEDYHSVLEKGRLKNGLVWPVPLSFAPKGGRNKQVIQTLSVGDEIALVDEEAVPVAIMKLEDMFAYNKEHRAKHLFGTTDRAHPGVDSIFRRMGDVALGGPITLLRRVNWGPFESLRLEPKDTWHMFYEKKNFTSIGGFITGANPLHRGHEYIHRNALEELDGLLIQPLVEMAKREYTRHEFRMLSYRSVLDTYYPKNRSVLAPLRVTYIFAGPRETVLHALIMKNYGCTHALIGRDHAGIGEFYDKYESHTIFDQITPKELGIDVRLFHEVFYCTRCDSLATIQTCPHEKHFHINISGTGIREMLRHGILPPKEIVRPESARIAMQGVQPKGADENNESIAPVGKTVKSIFPFYPTHSNLAGAKRPQTLEVEQMTIEDLKAAVMDTRSNADRIYKDIFDEISYLSDINRSLQPKWKATAHDAIRAQQEMVIEYLEEKEKRALATASDEFMYQDKEEVQRELDVAQRILEDIPANLSDEKFEYRTWNSLPYKHYRIGGDESEEGATEEIEAEKSK